MIHQVAISTEEELQQVWKDDRCPNLAFTFIEQALEECTQEDGSLVATYDTLVVPDGETMCFTYISSDGEVTYHLPAGEYGIRPSE